MIFNIYSVYLSMQFYTSTVMIVNKALKITSTCLAAFAHLVMIDQCIIISLYKDMSLSTRANAFTKIKQCWHVFM